MLRFFGEDETNKAIERLVESPELTVVAGAGVSAEVGLPTWQSLVNDLARIAADHRGRSKVRAAWLTDKILKGDLLSAAELVETILGPGRLEQALADLIYRTDRPDELEPGPSAHGIAQMKLAWGGGLRIVTTNYDRLLQQALVKAGIGDAGCFCSNTRDPGVIHLHGVLGAPDHGGVNRIVLTEGDFHRGDRKWQADVWADALDTPCLFVGTSLSDPSLLAALHQSESRRRTKPRHVALLRREPAHGQAEVGHRREWERVEAARWRRLDIQALFYDHYADPAQFLHELALQRAETAPARFTARFRAWSDSMQETLLRTDADYFRQAQLELSDGLADQLDLIRHELQLDPVMSIGISTLRAPSEEGVNEHVVNWGSSDRAMRTPDTIEALSLTAESNWTVVRALCGGVHRIEANGTYASRWNTIWAQPVFSASDRIPLGAVVLSSTSPAEVSNMRWLRGGGARTAYVLRNWLEELGRAFLMPPGVAADH